MRKCNAGKVFKGIQIVKPKTCWGFGREFRAYPGYYGLKPIQNGVVFFHNEKIDICNLIDQIFNFCFEYYVFFRMCFVTQVFAYIIILIQLSRFWLPLPWPKGGSPPFLSGISFDH